TYGEFYDSQFNMPYLYSDVSTGAVQYFSDGAYPGDMQKIAVTVTDANNPSKSGGANLFVEGDIVVQVTPSQISPGDTASIVVMHRNWDGSLSDFSPDQSFEVGIDSGSAYGTILSSGSTGGYFASIPQPFQFIAADSINADSVMVSIRVGYQPAVASSTVPGGKGKLGQNMKAKSPTINASIESSGIKTSAKKMSVTATEHKSVSDDNSFTMPDYGSGWVEIKKAGHFYVYATPDTINDSGSTTIHVQAQDENNENMSYSGKVQISASPSEYGHLGNSSIIPAAMQKGVVKGKQETLQSVNVAKKRLATMGDSVVVVDYGTAQSGQVIYTADGIAPDSSISIAITVTAVDQTSLTGKAAVLITGPKLIILQPTANSTNQEITHEPLMPTVTCQAQLQNYTGVQVTYNWMYSTADTLLEKTTDGDPLPPRYSGVGFFGNTSATGSNVSEWTVPFNGIFTGGKTLLIVNATTKEGKIHSDTVYANSIVGDNPLNPAEVKAGLSLEEQVIVYKESSPKWKQFNEGSNNNDEYNVKGNPIYGPPGGFGLMQLDNPPASEAELWNWKDNLSAGTSLFAQEVAGAAGYANRVRSGKTWYQDNSKYWHASDPVPFSWYGEVSPSGNHILQVAYPNARDLNQGAELLKEAFQRYNGGAYWRWIPHLVGNSKSQGDWEKGTSSNYGDNAWNFYQDVLNGNPPPDWN
ncbi:MAG: hypothetical protein WAO19_07645, partial [Candidatus Kryptoniota bacterium]